MNDGTEQEIISLKDLENKKVVQHNDLISSVAKMDLVPLKVFELAVSCIDTKNPPKDNTIYLSKKELFDFFDVNDTNKNSRFKQTIEIMQKQAYFYIQQTNEKNIDYESIVPVPYVKWNNYNDEVKIEFNKHIMPYLINLKENFTQYLITDIGKLNSKYSVIIYKWCSMNYSRYEKYSNKNCKNPYIDIKELRKLTDTENEYERFYDFEKRVLVEPIEDINKNTRFKIEYEKIKKGRSIAGIQFYIDMEKQEYEKSLNGKTKEKEEIENLITLLPDALQNEYILQLIELKIIKASEIDNILQIYTKIIPIYEEIESKYIYVPNNSLKGENVIYRHLEYLSKHMIDTENKNKDIVKYLLISINSFEEDLLIQARNEKSGYRRK